MRSKRYTASSAVTHTVIILPLRFDLSRFSSARAASWRRSNVANAQPRNGSSCHMLHTHTHAADIATESSKLQTANLLCHFKDTQRDRSRDETFMGGEESTTAPYDTDSVGGPRYNEDSVILK